MFDCHEAVNQLLLGYLCSTYFTVIQDIIPLRTSGISEEN